ncbi:type II toxin-antitoxin system VapC family toxin [Geminicoccus flavidas]|uniref:type II toxin-antitoxin system VapC family toxin n=1 Tax=Geminicoccus flavidas TaxID=2506407 RepID=UPI00135676B7|nr:type II toxin-antitoxin system VapC family toxin [Geminicoccus flavidas]
MIVLDASAALAAMFDDETAWTADELLVLSGRTLFVVPEHWPVEIASSLAAAERRKRIVTEQADLLIAVIRRLQVIVDEQSTDRTFDVLLPLARRHGMSVYDTAYLELAERVDAPLATFDKTLARVAGERGVRLVF